MLLITACILAKNEELRIEDALRSLMGWADQIVVLDNESTDGTAAIAERYGALVLPVKSPGTGVNFDALRNTVIDHATGDWILYIDADERIPPRLGPILKDLITNRGHEFEALVLPFKHYFCGKWMRHCGWWPGYTRPQLVKKGKFRYNERLHTGVAIDGRTFFFPPDDPDLAIVHFSYDNLDHYLGKLNRYTDGEAENLLAEGGSHSWQTQLAHFVHDWTRYYDNGHAREDGMHGFVLSFLSAFYRFASRAKLWDIRRQRGEIVNPTEPVPPSLQEAVAFMQDVARNGAEPWLKKALAPGANVSRRIPAGWYETDDSAEGKKTNRDASSLAASDVSTADITVCIVARNAEALVEDALKSVAPWARRIVFVDNDSSDATAEIGRRYTDHMLSVTDVHGHMEAVRYAVRDQIGDLAVGDWILYVDADERITPDLADLLVRLVTEQSDSFDILHLPFKNHFCGTWLRHSGQWPGYKASPQLVRKGSYVLNPVVHWGGNPTPGARVYYVPTDPPGLAALHYSVLSLSQWLSKENTYTTQEVALHNAQGVSSGWQSQIAAFAFAWQDMYETSRGDLDGMPGFIFAFLKGMSRFFVHAKLWDYRQSRKAEGTEDSDADELASGSPLPQSVAEILDFIGNLHKQGADRYSASISGARAAKAEEQAAANARIAEERLLSVPRLPLIWSGPLADSSGYAGEARQFVLGLAEANLPFALQPTPWGDDASGLTPTISALVGDRQVPDQAQPAPAKIFVSHTLPGLVRPSPLALVNVARVMFETDRLPAPWVRSLQALDRIWVPSAFNRDTFVASGISADKVAVIPAAVDSAFLEDAAEGDKSGGSETLPALPGNETFRFLSIFDWTLHKGWDVLIEAFAREFGDDSDVGLIVKTWSSNGYTLDDIRGQADAHLFATLGKHLGDLPNLHIWQERLPETQMPALYRSVQAYVTPTRGEGWCRPLMEAMATGLPVIATKWSGLTEFFDSKVGYALRHKLAPVSEAGAREVAAYAGHMWAEPDINDLRQLMRKIVEDPAAARRKGIAARKRIATGFSRSAVTQILRVELELCEILAGQHLNELRSRRDQNILAAEQKAMTDRQLPLPRGRSGKERAVLLQSASGEHTALLDIAEPWHRAYANAHGLAYVCHRTPLQTDRAANWDKILLIRDYLRRGGENGVEKQFEYLIWLDADTLVTDIQRDLRDALPADAWMGMVRHRSLGKTDGAQWFNSGAIYIRNTREAREYFDEVWQTWPAEHFWEDNMAMIRVLGYEPERFARGVRRIGDEWNATRLINEVRNPVVMAWHGSGAVSERCRLMHNVLNALVCLRRAGMSSQDGSLDPPNAVNAPLAANSHQSQEIEQAQALLDGMGHARSAPSAAFPLERPQANPVSLDFPDPPEFPDGTDRSAVSRGRKTGTGSAGNPPSQALRLLWEGDFAAVSSLSLVNRELALHLLDADKSHTTQIRAADLKDRSGEQKAALLAQDARLAALWSDLSGNSSDMETSRSSGDNDAAVTNVTFRHFFPPDWNKPATGKLVVMQPWEYGHVPLAWVESAKSDANQVWAYSRFVRDAYVRSGVPAEKVHVVPLGVRTDVFTPQGKRYHLPTSRTMRFLFVGGTIHRKGADLLAYAWRQAFRRDDDVCLVVKDMGTRTFYRGQNFAHEFQALQADPNAAEVHYLGDPEMPAETLASLYRSCSCVVLPYRAEGFALSPLEGMASGLPSIVTAGGPTDDYLDDTTALRVPFHRRMAQSNYVGPYECAGNPWTLEPDMDALIEALRWAYRNQDEMRLLGATARIHVEKGWTWERSAAIARRKLLDLSNAAAASLPQQNASAGVIGPSILVQKATLWTPPGGSLAPMERKGVSKDSRAVSGATRKAAASTQTVSAKKVALSLCMIARDEEPRIGKCLESIRPFVDEMIVVDTGSTDRTREIAAEAGARVYDFPWTDSFAEARNQSLALAQGNWVFWMDADDIIGPESGALLKQLIARHPNRDAAFQAQVRIPPGPDEHSESIVDHVKLFPNRPDLRFEHRIHEQILPALRKANLPIEFSDLYVTHSHYDRSPEGQAKKRRRDFRLLELDLREHPDHPFVLFNLGMTHLYATKDFEVAAHYLRRSLSGSHWKDSIVRKAYALLTTARTCQQDWESAIAANEEGRKFYPEDAELLFQSGQIYQQIGRMGEARMALERLIRNAQEPSRQGDKHYQSVSGGLQTYRARHELALLYRRMGDAAHCVHDLEQIVREYPGYEPARRDLVEMRANIPVNFS